MRSGKKHIVGDLELDSRVTAQALAGLYDNTMLLAFRLAVDGSLAKYNLVDGIMDEFEDETGVDVATSTNESYNATSDYYTNNVTYAGIDSYTKLLLHFNGNDGAKEIVDSGNTGHIVSQNGTSQLLAGGSLLLDGNSDYLTLADSDDWNFGTGDFTIDCWVRMSTLPSGSQWYPIVGQEVDAFHFWFLALRVSSGVFYWSFFSENGAGGNRIEFYKSTSLVANAWYHVALVRNGNSFSIYQNGTLVGTSTTNSNTIPDLASNLIIGYDTQLTGGSYYNGYIDELRVSKGIARWTTAFTPQTSQYSLDSYTKALLHFEGPNTLTSFTEDNGKTVSVVGTAQISNVYKVTYAKIGSSSLWLDGDSDYLTVPDHDDWNFGSGDFTIEGWFKFDSFPPTNNTRMDLFCQWEDVNNRVDLFLFNNSSTIQIYFEIFDNGSNIESCGGSPATPFALNTWTHIAIVRYGNDFSIYVDGVLAGSTDTENITYPDHSGLVYIGQQGNESRYVDGYIDEFRISKGIARYTTTFTPSTTAYTSDSYTKLLLHMNTLDYSGDYSGNNYKIPTFAGTAQLDTAQKKFDTASLLFDGDSDYITLPDSADWNFGSEDFTIDCWVRFNVLPDSGGTLNAFILNQQTDSTHTIQFCVYKTGSSYHIYFYHDNAGNTIIIDKASSPNLAINTWYHLAVVRNGSNWFMFQDGVRLGSTTVSSIVMSDIASTLDIGRHATGYYFNGWIDEFRISKGIARWTANFTSYTEEYIATDVIFDMSLYANVSTAESTPASSRIVLYEEDIASITLNTDLKVWVSRDNGTTWTQATLTDEGNYESNKRILAGNLDISGQPSGTSMKWKVTTHNSKNIKLHGIGLLWD